MIQLTENIFAVDLVDDTDINLVISEAIEGNSNIPEGYYEFLFTSNEVDEEKAKMVVEGNNGGINDTMFRDYGNTGFACFAFELPTESFASLLQSKNLTGNCAIVKKVK